MIAVLFNRANIRLGELDASEDTHVVEFGGAIFARKPQQAALDAGGWGVVFDQTLIEVRRDIDRLNPRKATVMDRK